MAGWDPIVPFVLACIAVIILGPTDYVSLAGFGIMGALAAVLVAGRVDIALPVFALAGAGTILFAVRTVGMLAGVWDRDNPTSREQQYGRPQDGVDDTNPDEWLWQ